jgi:NADH:ubiquinone oxidoreductase subunit 5 (subunit L)/multisubunit Na+/H+ antiporter MnhA subunit
MGGLIKKMPISFVSAMMAIIAMSGVPPLAGFGGKWLMYTSLIERGWHLQAALAFFASGLAFLYMYRLVHSIFLGQAKSEHKNVKEAPLWLTIPQVIFMGLLMGASMFPRFWVGKLSNVVGDFIPSTLAWSGQTATTSLGYWNGFMVMNVVGVIFVALLIWLMLTFQKVQKVKQFNIVFAGERPFTPETTHVAYNMYAPVQKALGGWVKPRATAFWDVLQSGHILLVTCLLESIQVTVKLTYFSFYCFFLCLTF